MLGTASDKLTAEENALRAVVASMATALQSACRWVEAKRSGVTDADRFLEAARTEAAIAQVRLPRVDYPLFRSAADKAFKRITAIAGLGDLNDAILIASAVPVPPLLIEVRAPYGGTVRPQAEPKETKNEGPFAIRLMLTLDGKAWANPQVLHPATLYDVGLTLTVPQWPEAADTLELDYVTTLPGDAYRVSSFRFSRAQFDEGHELVAKGHLEFQSGQSFFSEPVMLQLRATFLSSTDPNFTKSATVIGYHKLRARVTDPKQNPLLSRYRALDARILDIVDEIRKLPGVTEAHLADFVHALGALANYMGICAQQALYRTGTVIGEAEFQRNILIHLRQQLGEEVQEAPKQAGGITDVQYRSVTIELKVEKKISDRQKMVETYENQASQYGNGLGRQLGILCVLDMTKKDSPPAPTQNNLLVLKPKLHGFSDDTAPAPARLVAVVIDGNLRKPSSYSR